MRHVVPFLVAFATTACSTAAVEATESNLGCSAGQSFLAFAAILVPLFWMKRQAA